MVKDASSSEQSTAEAEQRAAALEIARREALRSGRTVRGVLSLIRVSDPPTPAEQLLLAASRILRIPHAIMPQPCQSVAEWMQRYGDGLFRGSDERQDDDKKATERGGEYPRNAACCGTRSQDSSGDSHSDLLHYPK